MTDLQRINRQQFGNAFQTSAPNANRTECQIRCRILANRLSEECDRITYIRHRTRRPDASTLNEQVEWMRRELEQKYAAMRSAALEWMQAGAAIMFVLRELREVIEQFYQQMQMLNSLTPTGVSAAVNRTPPPDNTTEPALHGHPTIRVLMPARFEARDPLEFRRLAADNAMCCNCLEAGDHTTVACPHPCACDLCDEQHHRLLHLTDDQHDALVTNILLAPMTTRLADYGRYPKFRATAVVDVLDVAGVPHRLRAILDLGAVMSMVSQEAARTLRLPRTQENVAFVGVNGVDCGHGTQSIQMRLSDRHGLGYTLDVRAFVKAQLTGGRWQSAVPLAENWPHIGDLVLADPEFMDRRPFDILLGSDVYGGLLRPGLRQRTGMPTAQNTIFGWVVSGVLTQDGYEAVYGRPKDRDENAE